MTTVDVHDYGAVGKADADPAEDDTVAIQAALDTKNNVYLPSGVYRISGTLRFYDSQAIFGDAKGRSRPGTRIVVSGGIAAFRSAHHPFLTRDVLIRDLGIWNMQGTDVVHGGVSDSVAVDFTGVGFSGLQRLSVDYHEIGIIGRDTATFSATVGADSSGTVLKVPAPYPDFAAPGEQVTVNDPSDPPDVTSTVRIARQVTDASDPDYPALILSSNTPLKKTYHKGALVYPSPIGGYYVSVEDCEINQCRKGLWLSHAANNWTVLGGRFAGNDYGIYAEHIDGSSFQSAFEHNGAGVLFRAAAECQVRSGSYFEANGPDNIKGWGVDKLEAYGAVCFTGGSWANVVEPAAISNSSDSVVDDSDGSNICTAPLLPAFPSVPSGHSSGRNALFNSDFAVDSAARGIADGWSFVTPPPPGWTMAVVTGDVPGGAPAAQQWNLDPGSYDLTKFAGLQRAVTVIPGQWYTFTGRTKVGPHGAGLFQLRIADDQRNTYLHTAGLPEHDWPAGLHRYPFQVHPSATRLYLNLELYGGKVCTVTNACTALFAKFQLEPGRGLPTESRDSGLMGHIATGGPPLDPATSQDGTSIHVTHPYHVVKGSGTLLHIIPPAGFSGTIMLRADGPWRAATGGTGPGAIGNAFSMTPGKTAIGWYDGLTGTWWFTVSA